MMEIDLDHLRTWVGREETVSELLPPVLAQRFLATFDREGESDMGAQAPLFLHHCLCHPCAATAELGPDGHPKRGEFLPPVTLPRRMWAGGAIDFHSPPRVGETVTRRSKITDVSVKQGRSGTLCFVTVTHDYDAEGRAILSEEQDIVYREAATPGASPKLPPAAPMGAKQRQISPSPDLLFRYSAITFNSHRIHYDLPYATLEEGYPGLVVHGPMQAALLGQFAADLAGAAPSRFTFRGLSPAFSGPSLVLHATEEDGGMSLWSAAPGGPVAMKAQATW
ncbi:MaoC family dehydratase N-terminal domain-containing protein [Vannielia sp.]|uniref:FAS1-like dehydratase domain-containing protein n=1 Tax=Vannielia sp. TaxID=2813045 RepID=UPI00260BD9E4|nr:MaoC family dehydratase N-terminal domain-containing protein [Vannielia sp.]MDF1871629.1 MaoC family dehydratase N-terminal domain-containing protein [Vannielia sp.]